jgi:hypothetical protein
VQRGAPQRREPVGDGPAQQLVAEAMGHRRPRQDVEHAGAGGLVERVDQLGVAAPGRPAQQRQAGGAAEHRRELHELDGGRRQPLEPLPDDLAHALRRRDLLGIADEHPPALVLGERADVGEVAPQLADEERVAGGEVAQHAGQRAAARACPEADDELLDGRDAEPAQRDALDPCLAVELGHRAGQPGLQLVLAIGGHDEQRRVARPLCEVLEQTQRRAVGPVQVVEDEQHRARAPDRDEQVEHRVVQTVPLRGRVAVDRGGKIRQVARKVGEQAHELAGPRAGCVAQLGPVDVLDEVRQRLDEGLVGRGQVRVAGAVEHRRLALAGAARQLPGQARLAAPRLAADERNAAAVGAGVAPQLAQRRQLDAAPHKWQRRRQPQRSGKWEVGHSQS